MISGSDPGSGCGENNSEDEKMAFAGFSAVENDLKGSLSVSELAAISGSGHMIGMDGAAPSSGAGELAFAGFSAAENDFKGCLSPSVR